MNLRIYCLIILLLLAAPCFSQEVVSVGKGSYASAPPVHEGEAAQKAMTRKLYIVDQGDRPVPTNDWWTDLIVNKYSGGLWAYPLKVTTHERGASVFFPKRWTDGGNDMVSELPLEIGGVDFKPADASAKTDAIVNANSERVVM